MGPGGSIGAPLAQKRSGPQGSASKHARGGGRAVCLEEATARLSADRPASDAEFLLAILSSVARVEARSYAALPLPGVTGRPLAGTAPRS